jgi:hypothetical protein|nr:MAG TPA: nucelotide kinase [Caudoviricetes sp.]
MQRKCSRCGEKYTLVKDEKYCPDCMKVMTPPTLKVKQDLKTTECEGCGIKFSVPASRPRRPPKYCPECAVKHAKKSKVEKLKKASHELQKEEVAKQEIIATITKHLEAKPATNKATIKEEKVVTPAKLSNIEHDVVNHPSHYTRGNIEVIDFIEDQQLPYHLGNVVKYIARAGFKGDKIEDLKKSTMVSQSVYPYT